MESAKFRGNLLCLSLEFSLPLLQTMSVVNVLPQQENNFSFQTGKLSWRCAARGVLVSVVGFFSLIWLCQAPPSSAGCSLLCAWMVCRQHIPEHSRLGTEKWAVCGLQEQARRWWLRRSFSCGTDLLWCCVSTSAANWGTAYKIKTTSPLFSTPFWGRGISCQACWKVWTASLAVVWFLTEEFTACFPGIIIVGVWWIQTVFRRAARPDLTTAIQQSRHPVLRVGGKWMTPSRPVVTPGCSAGSHGDAPQLSPDFGSVSQLPVCEWSSKKWAEEFVQCCVRLGLCGNFRSS